MRMNCYTMIKTLLLRERMIIITLARMTAVPINETLARKCHRNEDRNLPLGANRRIGTVHPVARQQGEDPAHLKQEQPFRHLAQLTQGLQHLTGRTFAPACREGPQADLTL